MVEQSDVVFQDIRGDKDVKIHNRDSKSDRFNPYKGPGLRQTSNYPPTLKKSLLVGILGAFQHGYEAHVLNLPWKVSDRWVDEWYLSNRTEALSSSNVKLFITTSFRGTYAIGGIIGAFLAIRFYNNYGLRQSLLLSGICAVIAYAFSSSTNLFGFLTFVYLGRFSIGAYCGVQTVLIPLHLIEISRRDTRGPIFASCSAAYSFGFLISQILGQESLLGRQDNWDYLLSLPLLCVFLQMFIIRCHLCEFPRDLLINQNNEEESRRALEKLCFRRLAIEEELREMREEARQIKEDRFHIGPVRTIGNILRAKGIQNQLILGCIIQVIQQFSGFNNLLYMSTEILEHQSIQSSAAYEITLTMCSSLFIVSMISIIIIGCTSRRIQFLAGLVGLLIGSLLISLLAFQTTKQIKYYLCMISLIIYAAGYAIGPLTLTPLISSEIFTYAARPASLAIFMIVQWTCNLISTISVPILEALMGRFLFLPNTLLIILSIRYLYHHLPETKDLTFTTMWESFCYVEQDKEIEMQVIDLSA